MKELSYVNHWRQAVHQPRGLVARGRAVLRSSALHAAATMQRHENTPFLRALYCHYVFDDQVGDFEQQIVRLKAIGSFVDTNTLVEMLQGRRPITGPSFHLSFDDGFRNIYTNALPVLQRHGVPAIFFVPSGLVGANLDRAHRFCLETTGYAGVIEMVRWEELRQMQEVGIEIGSHTRTHARFSMVSSSPARLHDELHGSKVELEEQLGRECRFISWPYGTRRDADVVSLAAVATGGYTACFGAFRRQVLPKATDRWSIPRHHFEPQWPWNHVRYFAQGGYES